MSRILNDRVDNIQTATLDWHRRKMFNALFYQSEFRTGRFGEPGPGVVIHPTGVYVMNGSGELMISLGTDGVLWITVGGVLSEVKTFDDGSGHNVLYV